jgi:hypothetical protein
MDEVWLNMENPLSEDIGTAPPTAPLPLDAEVAALDAEVAAPVVASEPPPSYVKLAMRNMVRKRGQSLRHFFLTATGLLAVFVGLAYLTR